MPPANILIVEDEPVLANAIRINLENLGYCVPGIYTEGEAALDHVISNPPDLVIMDVTLQGKLDGVQIAERIRSGSNIPVIFITAHADPNTIRRAIATSPFGYLVKPFQTRELHLNVELALQNRAMEKTIRDQAERARTLARVAVAGQPYPGIAQVLDSVCDEVMAIFAVPEVAITLVEEGADQVMVAAAKGPAGAAKAEAAVPIPASLYNTLWESGGPVVQIPDLSAYRQLLPGNQPHLKDLQSVVIAFLVSGERLVGSINIPGMDAPRTFSEADLSLLQAIAELASIAIAHARLFEQVTEGRRRLQTLSRQLVEVQEAERRHLANELHDQVGQMLTGLLFSLEMGKILPEAEARESMAASQEIVKEIIAQVRELSLDLRPSLLDDMGLSECLAWHFERYTRQTGIQVQFAAGDLGDQRFAAEIEITVFRIIQEALTNIARHAAAQEAFVCLQVNDADICIDIRDQGRGFDPASVEAEYESSGLGGMRERANLVGGQLEIESTPGMGTLVTARIPTHKFIERRRNGRIRIAGR